jgi:hypothetical protein
MIFYEATLKTQKQWRIYATFPTSSSNNTKKVKHNTLSSFSLLLKLQTSNPNHLFGVEISELQKTEFVSSHFTVPFSQSKKMEGVDHLAFERKKAQFDVNDMKIVWAGSRQEFELSDWISRLVASDPVNSTVF